MSVLPRSVSRRRAIVIVAGAAAALWPGFGRARSGAYEWTGTALGAAASIRLYHRDHAAAEAAVVEAVAEIERLESEFSLYRTRSAISRLNRDGRHIQPSHDMRRLLMESRRFGDLTGGLFDVTVQPLWELYARHFAAFSFDPAGPLPDALNAALASVDYRRIGISGEAIELGNGIRVTFNGIAQGYITDRIADLLRRRGWTNVLIDLGEIRGLGVRPDGHPWRVALRDATGPAILGLNDGALATSAWNGTVFDRRARFGHLFDPRRGPVRTEYRSITVAADDATTADAMSTTLAVAPVGEIAALARRAKLRAVWIVDHLGQPKCIFARTPADAAGPVPGSERSG